jgi:hypothetical protein
MQPVRDGRLLCIAPGVRETNREDQEDRQDRGNEESLRMRSRFLPGGAARRAAASLRAAGGKARVELAPDILISMRFPARRAQRGRPEAAPGEEAKAHAFAVSAVFVVPNQAAIYVAMYKMRVNDPG